MTRTAKIEQQARQDVTDRDAARALRHQNNFLRLFVKPRSPTDIASQAGMAPNLAHHHARKLAVLGLRTFSVSAT